MRSTQHKAKELTKEIITELEQQVCNKNELNLFIFSLFSKGVIKKLNRTPLFLLKELLGYIKRLNELDNLYSDKESKQYLHLRKERYSLFKTTLNAILID